MAVEDKADSNTKVANSNDTKAAERKLARANSTKSIAGRGVMSKDETARILKELRENPTPENYTPDPNFKMKKSASVPIMKSTRGEFLVSEMRKGVMARKDMPSEFAGYTSYTVENQVKRGNIVTINDMTNLNRPSTVLIASRPTFGTASRFPRNVSTAEQVPGPKYSRYDNVEEGTIDGPAFHFGTDKAARTSFITGSIHHGLLCTSAAPDATNVGPAGYNYDTAKIMNKRKTTASLWSRDGSAQRYDPNASKMKQTPGPKYYIPARFKYCGINLGPKKQPIPRNVTPKPTTSEAASPVAKTSGEEGGTEKEAVVATDENEGRSRGPKLKAHAHFAQRNPVSMYIGKKWADRGLSSPGPVYYPNLSSFAKTPPKPYIPIHRGWCP